MPFIFHDNKFLTASEFPNTFHLNSSNFLKYFELCHKNRLFNFHFKVLIILNTIKVKILPNITKF